MGCPKGRPIALFLFQVVLQFVLQPVIDQCEREGLGIHLAAGQWLSTLIFADDTTIVAANPYALCVILERVATAALEAGLRLQPRKCKWMAHDPAMRLRQVQLQDNVIPYCANIKVLGVMYNHDMSLDPETSNRINRGYATFHDGETCFRTRAMGFSRKTPLLFSVVMNSLLWCTETVAFSLAQLRRLDHCWNDVVRKSLGLKSQLACEIWPCNLGV